MYCVNISSTYLKLDNLIAIVVTMYFILTRLNYSNQPLGMILFWAPFHKTSLARSLAN